MNKRSGDFLWIFLAVFLWQYSSFAEQKAVTLQDCRFEARWVHREDSTTQFSWSDRLVPEVFSGEGGRGLDILEQPNMTVYSQRIPLDTLGNILSVQLTKELGQGQLQVALIKKGTVKTEVLAKTSTRVPFSESIQQKIILQVQLENPRVSNLRTKDFGGPEVWELSGFPQKERVLTSVQVQCVFHLAATEDWIPSSSF